MCVRAALAVGTGGDVLRLDAGAANCYHVPPRRRGGGACGSPAATWYDSAQALVAHRRRRGRTRRRRLWLTGGDVVGLGAGVEPQQPARVLLRPPLQPHRRPRRRLVRLRVCVCVWGGNESSEGLTATPRPPANRSDAYLHQRHCISPYLSSRPRRRLVRLRARVCVGVTSHQRD